MSRERGKLFPFTGSTKALVTTATLTGELISIPKTHTVLNNSTEEKEPPVLSGPAVCH